MQGPLFKLSGKIQKEPLQKTETDDGEQPPQNNNDGPPQDTVEEVDEELSFTALRNQTDCYWRKITYVRNNRYSDEVKKLQKRSWVVI